MRSSKFILQLALGTALAGIWSSTAFAAGAAAAADEARVTNLNEVVVTARRKEETLQNVPMTVTAVTSEDMKQYNIFSGQDIAQLAPGLEFKVPPANSDVNLSIRGAGKGPGTAATATVETYLNEAPINPTNAYQSIYDLGQIEVLRGPQGTLRGRPASSGAITFTTARPNLSKFGGSIQGSISNHDQRRAEGAINIPIVEDIFGVRFAAVHDENDNGGIKSVNSSKDPKANTNSWRASARFKPNDSLDMNVMYQDFWSHLQSFSPVYGTGYRGPVLPANYNGPPIGIKDRLGVGKDLASIKHHDRLLAGNISWEIAPHFQLTYVGSYFKLRTHNYGGDNTGNFYGPTVIPPSSQYVAPGTSNSQEVRLESSGNSFWDYGVGAFYQSQHGGPTIKSFATYLPGVYGVPRGPQSLANFNPYYSYFLDAYFPTQSKTKAIYANSTFHVTPSTELFVGARYTEYTASQAQTGVLKNGVSATGVPSAACALVPGSFPSPVRVGQCDLPLANIVAFGGPGTTNKYHPWVYQASLTQHFSDNMTGYVSFGHAWRAGVINFNISSNDPRITGLSPSKPETSNNYEVGLKTALLDHTLTINVAAFYQQYNGFIVFARAPYINNTGPTPTVTAVGGFNYNADAKVRGVDLEIDYRPSRQFSIGGGVNYAKGRLSNAPLPCNDGNFDGVLDAIIPTVAGFNAAGTPLALCKSNQALTNQPDWAANLQAEYNMPISGTVDAYVRTLSNYTAKNDYALFSNFHAKAYTIVNLFAGVRSHEGGWDLGVYARNVFNTKKVVNLGATEIATPSDGAQLGAGPSTGYRDVYLTDRREFGATARYAF